MSTTTQRTFSGYQHLGRRTTQEDRFYTDARVIKGVHIYILAVADGMGGHNAGELAAEIAIQGVRKYFSDIDTVDVDSLKSSLKAAFLSSNEKIRIEAENNQNSAGMGTTLTCALVIDDEMFVCHVGDSRAYLITRDNIYQCTKDHTAYQDGLDRGIDVGNIKIGNNALTRCMDGESDFKPDLSKMYNFDHGQLLICSDGVYGVLDNNKIQSIANSSSDAHSSAKYIVEEAMAMGASDNVTAACLAFQNSKPVPIPIRANKKSTKRVFKKLSVILSILMLGALSLTGWSGYKYVEMNSVATVAEETEIEMTTENDGRDDDEEINYIDNRNEIVSLTEYHASGLQIEGNGIESDSDESADIQLPITNGDEEIKAEPEAVLEDDGLNSEDDSIDKATLPESEGLSVEEDSVLTEPEINDRQNGFDGDEKQYDKSVKETKTEENEAKAKNDEEGDIDNVTQVPETEELPLFGFYGDWQEESNTGYCIQVHTLDEAERVADLIFDYSNRNIRIQAFPSVNRPDATIICIGQFETQVAAENFMVKCEYNFCEGSKIIRIDDILE